MSKKTSQAVRIEVVFKPDLDDTRGRRIRDRIARDLGIRLKAIRVADVYTLDLDLSEMEINRVRRTFHRPAHSGFIERRR